MKSGYNTAIEFTQLYVNVLNERKKKNEPVEELLLFSLIESFFGRTYIRFYVGLPAKSRKDNKHWCWSSLVTGDGEYISYQVVDRNDNVNEDHWVESYKITVETYERDVTYFVGIIKAVFPELKILNHLKKYPLPYSHRRTGYHWYDEAEFTLPYVVNNSDVEDINDYVSNNYYGGAHNLHSPYDARITNEEFTVKEIKEENEKTEKYFKEIKEVMKQTQQQTEYANEMFDSNFESLKQPSETMVKINKTITDLKVKSREEEKKKLEK